VQVKQTFVTNKKHLLRQFCENAVLCLSLKLHKKYKNLNSGRETARRCLIFRNVIICKKPQKLANCYVTDGLHLNLSQCFRFL